MTLIKIKKVNSFSKITLTKFRGILFLHLGTGWIQGIMRINNPLEIIIDYVQQMMIWRLFNTVPKHIVQLAQGNSALTKFSYLHFFKSKITTIELNSEVIKICQNRFYLSPDDHRLNVI